MSRRIQEGVDETKHLLYSFGTHLSEFLFMIEYTFHCGVNGEHIRLLTVCSRFESWRWSHVIVGE